MLTFTPEQLDAHAAMLADRVYQVHTKWPHFQQLLTWIRKLGDTTPAGATVVSLERTLLYGGISLAAPFFQRHNFISVDCSPESADERGAFNASFVDDPGCIRIPYTCRAKIDDIKLDDGIADLVMVPNLVHHVADQDRLFSEMARLLKKGGELFVFEAILRELHQIPDDYLRYTPYGMRNMLLKAGLEPHAFELEGGPFQAITYCWVQALEYFPPEKRVQMERWYYEEHFPELMKWDSEYRDNLCRKHTAFPVSFVMTARKP
jgi:SAM-dependent methyltransferase